MADQQSHDPKKVSLVVAGITITQFAKGTYITAEYDSDAYTDEVGAGGEVVRILNHDRRATIKITLMAASPSNTALSALAAIDRLTGKGVGAVQLKDNGPGGASIASAQAGWVKRMPAKPYATEASNIEWEIRCAELDSTVAGTVAA